eukprot:6185579-Pleurochrysis_carterae.AAC.3
MPALEVTVIVQRQTDLHRLHVYEMVTRAAMVCPSWVDMDLPDHSRSCLTNQTLTRAALQIDEGLTGVSGVRSKTANSVLIGLAGALTPTACREGEDGALPARS